MTKKPKPEPLSGIYAIVNFAERRFYVGSSVDIICRFGSHKERLNCGKHHSKKLQEDWDRLGRCSFSFLVLETGIDLVYLQDREKFWMDALKGRDFYNGTSAAKRKDNRYYKLEIANTKNGPININQSVYYFGKEYEIKSIDRFRGQERVWLDGGQAYAYSDLLIPVECE